MYFKLYVLPFVKDVQGHGHEQMGCTDHNLGLGVCFASIKWKKAPLTFHDKKPRKQYTTIY